MTPPGWGYGSKSYDQRLAPAGATNPAGPAEDVPTLLRALDASLMPRQREEIRFEWDHVDRDRGHLRSFIANHWQATRPAVNSDFFTTEQRHLVHGIYRGVLDPHWYPRFLQALRDDTKGHDWGANQGIALFADDAGGRLQLVFCGRHTTLRANAHTDPHFAFGGPILYAHAVGNFFERPRHPGNVFWNQAILATALFDALGEEQRVQAVVDRLPPERAIGFRDTREGVAASTFDTVQRGHLDRLLASLFALFSATNRAVLQSCLDSQGGPAALHVMFSRDGRMSAPLWDNWRIEGPSFVWHFRGFPHVHVLVHVADHTDIPVNAHEGVFIFPGHDPLR